MIVVGQGKSTHSSKKFDQAPNGARENGTVLQANTKGHGKGEPIKVPCAPQKIFHGALEYDTDSNQ